MTLQDWGAIGEVVCALAVVITLIYLAKQIKQNTHAMEQGRRLALAQTYHMHYQYQQGYLDEEYYEDKFKDRVARLAPTWKALGLTSGRRSFFAEIERLSRERSG